MNTSRIFLFVGILGFFVGCNQQAGQMPKATTDAVTTTSFNVAGAPTVEFNAPDMMCPEGCGAKVKEILSGQPGAKEVVVDFDAKTAKVAVEDATKFDSNAAVAALVDHGFKNSSIKAEPANEKSPATSTEKAKDNSAG